MPYAAIRRGIADAVDLVLHLERRNGRRVLTQLVRVTGLARDESHFDVEPV
jgi:Flp pilus assembly CpaF family ATPase